MKDHDQGRLRGLLRANQLIISDLGLELVLLRIVEAARELVGAQYAALGVLAPDGGLAEFVHSGMPADTVHRIGRLPQGKGLLGALIDDPRPIRLLDIGADPRSSGFPLGIRRCAASSVCRSGSGVRCSAICTCPRAGGVNSVPRTRN